MKINKLCQKNKSMYYLNNILQLEIYDMLINYNWTQWILGWLPIEGISFKLISFVKI